MSNDTQTITLAGFLLARIAEDEAAAETAAEWEGEEWSAGDEDEAGRVRGRMGSEVVGGGYTESTIHIARHDPARVLAECEAKRLIAELHKVAGEDEADVRFKDFDLACVTCGTYDEYPVEWPCDTLRLLALPYADHPDYRDGWRDGSPD